MNPPLYDSAPEGVMPTCAESSLPLLPAVEPGQLLDVVQLALDNDDFDVLLRPLGLILILQWCW